MYVCAPCPKEAGAVAAVVVVVVVVVSSSCGGSGGGSTNSRIREPSGFSSGIAFNSLRICLYIWFYF